MKSRHPIFYSSLSLAVALAINTGTSHANSYGNKPKTPIQHVIVVIGENVSFDTLYGAYQAPKGQTIKNLLSEGIINVDGSPGPNFSKAQQREGFNVKDKYTVKPTPSNVYPFLPQPLQIGILDASFQFAGGVPDLRFPATLPNGPFPITK
jgi:phospholipase C